jgi:TolA-binding protein
LGGLLLSVSPLIAEEVTERAGVIDYIQELTGKIDILTKTIDELQKRIEVLENCHQSKTIEKKDLLDKSAPPAQIEKGKPKKLPPLSADRLWSDAMGALQQKQYEIADQKLADFVHFYGDTSRAAEGYYWLGEIQLLNKQYNQAQIYYANAYKIFVETDIRKAETGLKIADCYFALNKLKEGCLFLKEVMKLQQKGAAVSTATLQLVEQYWAKYKCADL